MSFIEQIARAQTALAQRRADPWKNILERALPASMTAVSTNALLDLVGLPQTTGAARRIAPTMRRLGWVAIKNRQLVPGGWRGTHVRGWSRPSRQGRELVVRARSTRESPRTSGAAL